MADHPDAIEKWAILDIAPTLASFERASSDFARTHYHWFFLSQPYNLPEHLIGCDPAYYLRKKLASWSKTESAFSEEVIQEYVHNFSDPAAIHASCKDYRAAAGIDLTHDRADLDRKIAAQLLALWGLEGRMGKLFDILSLWRERVADVHGRGLPGGHFLPEEQPELVLNELRAFFS